MRISIITFDGFNEIDSFVACNILNRHPGWKAEITAPSATVRSMNGVTVSAQCPLEDASESDVALVGSGVLTPRLVEDRALMARLKLNAERQLVGSQCSGALVLAALGMLRDMPACTDGVTRPLLQAAGIQVLEQPFYARGNIGTAGGCLSAQYLAAWVLWRLAGQRAAEEALRYVVPASEERQSLSRSAAAVRPFIQPDALVLRPTRCDDIDYVLALERQSENRSFIAQWAPEEHMSAIARSDQEHWIIEKAVDQQRLGYLIAFDLCQAGFGVYVKRIVVKDKSRGLGRVALRSFARHAFSVRNAPRVLLAVYADNLRAQRSYEAVGFGPVALSGSDKAALQAAVGGFPDSSVVMQLAREELRTPVREASVSGRIP